MVRRGFSLKRDVENLFIASPVFEERLVAFGELLIVINLSSYFKELTSSYSIIGSDSGRLSKYLFFKKSGDIRLLPWAHIFIKSNSRYRSIRFHVDRFHDDRSGFELGHRVFWTKVSVISRDEFYV